MVRVGNFLAVVAPREWAAVRAATALKATWANAQNLPASAELAQWSRTTTVERDQAVVTVRRREGRHAAGVEDVRGQLLLADAERTRRSAHRARWPM